MSFQWSRQSRLLVHLLGEHNYPIVCLELPGLLPRRIQQHLAVAPVQTQRNLQVLLGGIDEVTEGEGGVVGPRGRGSPG